MISLQKGQKLSLEKNGSPLKRMCVGVNWGAIQTKTFFGTKSKSVDLDASAVLFDGAGHNVGLVYFGNLSTKGIRHSGDDRVGDTGGDDGLDNEVIEVDLDGLDANVESVVFVLNSFNNVDFKDIPYASVRLYEGTPDNVQEVVANYNIANDAKFAGSLCMVLGKLYKHNGQWKFSAIGEPTKDHGLEDLINTVKAQYV